MHPMKRFAAALFTLFVVSSLASVASAEIPPLLREATHKMWASGALGPLVGVRNGRIDVSTGFGSVEAEVEPPGQFGFYQTFGLHFSGPAGPAIAFDLQEGFGDDAITFIMMPKFVYDIRIVPGLGLYLSPMAGLGFALIAPDDCPQGAECDSSKGATFQTAFEGKLILGDRGMVFFRPFQLEFLFMDLPGADQMVTLVRYGLMFGGGVIF